MYRIGKNKEEMDLYMNEQLRTENVLESLIPIHMCQIKVLKPRKQWYKLSVMADSN